MPNIPTKPFFPGKYPGRKPFTEQLRAYLAIIAILLGFNLPLHAQLPCDCTIRWDGNSSDSWDNGIAVDIPGGGVIGCGQGAGTDGIDPIPGCVYGPGLFDASGALANCFDPDNGNPINLPPPLPGQKITFINFDVRQFGGSFEFQINNQSQMVGWILFYVDPGLATAGVGPNGLSGDCSPSALIGDACGINFTGWANSTFTTPEVAKATNYYLMVWNTGVQDLNNDGVYDNADATPQNNDGFNFNFKARYGCGDSDVVLCNLEEGLTFTTCSADGSTYSVSTTVNGANGNYQVADNTGQALSIVTAPDPLLLTNLGEAMPVVMGTVIITYPAGVDYDFTIAENGDPDAPNPPNSADCMLDISGTAPTCCTCTAPPLLACPEPVNLGCNPPLDNRGLPGSLAPGGLHEPAPSSVTASTDAGCTATITFISDGLPTTTDGCNYSLLRTYQGRNDCGGMFSICTQEFSWKISGTPELSPCPAAPVLGGCATQEEIDAAWTVWIDGLNNMAATGTCNPTVNFSPPLASLEKPMACSSTEQQVPVVVFASDDCGQSPSVTCAFTVGAYPGGLALSSCPDAPALEGCATGSEIKDAFSEWIIGLENMSATGGCNPEAVFSQDPASLVEPTACSLTEQQVSITVYAADHCEQTDPVTCTFTVRPADPLATACPGDVELENCETQEEINAQFTAWISMFGTEGGCNPSVYYTVDGQTLFSLGNVQAPDFCGGNVAVTIQADGFCGQSASCTATFSVEGDSSPPILTEARDTIVECDGNGNIDGLDSWLANHGRATATDNCRQITWSDDYMALNSLCGETGSATVTFTATDLCGNPASTTATFTIEDSTPPQGSCPQGFSGLTDTAQAPAPDVVLIENLYSDLCGGISVEVNTETEVETTCQGAEFEVRHVYTITDDCGNPTICVVTHAGLAPTEITGNCPDGEANLQCPNEVPPPDTQYIASFYTGADGRPVAAILSNIDASETDSCGFAITYEYTIHDNCGNTLTCGVTYSGEDTIPPQGSCPEGYEVASLEDAPPPDAGWIGSFYSDNCGPVSVQVLNTTQTGSFCEGFAVTHDYIVRDACGQDNTTLCSVSFTVPPASPLDGACPSGISGLQCWAEAPGHEEALDTVQNAYPFAAVIYLGTTTINNYCQFTIRHSYSIDDPCSGRIICVLEYSGQDQTPPEGSCPDGIEGLSCQVDVPAPGPNSIAAGYSDNCSTVHAYLMETITNGDDCGPFSVTYRYNVYDDCDNSAICEVSHTGVGLGMRPTPPVIHIEENTEGLPESPLPGFKAYPNPTTGELFLELNYLNEEEARLEIYNILGKRLLSKTTEPGQLVHRLDLARERLPNGTYLITVRKGKMCITRRVLLKKD